ncbi:hypothetical protein [Alkalicoccobacillus murimartini]|uniref:Uncharacterized protein n=1 Tax=Alkalicoccobacillus murimartini TaxID=171685 RepID=A0ABT9YPC0_9BACI|nr:hypothetical protein [Alkalicoccobacillus murimartini]MDQ0209052.1 hypothetical protein [Alkalicoccobacillus murimartini]
MDMFITELKIKQKKNWGTFYLSGLPNVRFQFTIDESGFPKLDHELIYGEEVKIIDNIGLFEKIETVLKAFVTT